MASTFQKMFSSLFHSVTAHYFDEKNSVNPENVSPSVKQIVILGGSYAAVSTAHRIFKQSSKNLSFKITMVTPNTHLYWNIAAPRGIIPGEFDDEKLFRSIEAGFKLYAPTQFEFILGTAESLNADSKTIGISSPHGADRSLAYDYLILATGSRTRDGSPFKALHSTEATQKALREFQAQVTKAKNIVVAGGGVTGVEVVGELAFAYGHEKDIILVANGSTIAEGAKLPTSVSKIAIDALHHLKVDVRFNTSVITTTKMANGQQELSLSDGSKLTTEMYIPTFGLIPNSSYVPAKFLDPQGFVMVDEHLAVKAAKDVWAIGDVSDTEFPQFLPMDRQSKYIAKAITSILSNTPVAPYKAMSTRFCGIQIGRYTATGHYGNIRIPSFFVSYVRRDLFTHMTKGMTDGTSF